VDRKIEGRRIESGGDEYRYREKRSVQQAIEKREKKIKKGMLTG
jgi:hypothetical protein